MLSVFIPSVTIKPIMLSVVRINVVKLKVVAFSFFACLQEGRREPFVFMGSFAQTGTYMYAHITILKDSARED
jgi:hypothetical protein